MTIMDALAVDHLLRETKAKAFTEGVEFMLGNRPLPDYIRGSVPLNPSHPFADHPASATPREISAALSPCENGCECLHCELYRASRPCPEAFSRAS